MTHPISCPTDETLQELLLGNSDPSLADELEEHVLSCVRCGAAAAALHAEDSMVQAIRHVGRAGDTPLPRLAETLVPVFQMLRPSTIAGATVSWGEASIPCECAPPEHANETARLGQYVLYDRLGAGGMGIVHRGFDTRLQRAIAVKFLHRELLAAEGMTERFLAEARAAAAVEHDNIVVVHSVEIHDGVPCIIMPLLQGETLEQRLLAAKGPLPTGEVSRIARECVAGLVAAHARGLLHRDIKPANVWLEAPTGRVKILDFGLAIASEAGSATTAIAGTPGYMAPEQVRGQGIDARADLFSLGCILYRAATGTPAFDGGTPTATLVQVLTRDAAPVALASPALSPALARLIDHLLARNPAGRPASAMAVAEELDAIEAEATARRVRITRRRWIAGIGAAGIAGALGVWFTRPKPTVVEPVRMEFATDPEVNRVVFVRDDMEQVFDLKSDNALSLAPGDYRLRTEVAVPGRSLVPAVVTVEAGEPRLVKLALVGEVKQSQAHTQAVTGIAFVPGAGQPTVLSAGLDRTVQAWRPGTGTQPGFERLSSPALCFAAAPDGTIAVTAGGNKQAPHECGIQLWNGNTLKTRGLPLEGHTRLVTAAAISSDGKRLLSASADDVRIWDVASREFKPLTGHADGARIHAAAFDAIGQRALTGDDTGHVILWNADDGQMLKKLFAQFPGEVGAVRAVVFTEKGFITTGDDGVIRVWAGEPLLALEFPVRGKPIRSLALSKDGKRLLSGDDEGYVKLWSLTEGTLIHTFTGHKRAVNAVAFAPDGREAVSGGQDRTVRLWRLPFE